MIDEIRLIAWKTRWIPAICIAERHGARGFSSSRLFLCLDLGLDGMGYLAGQFGSDQITEMEWNGGISWVDLALEYA
jgi:hypothetical protein